MMKIVTLVIDDPSGDIEDVLNRLKDLADVDKGLAKIYNINVTEVPHSMGVGFRKSIDEITKGIYP